ncbi:MAG: 5' nucleotidase, NT5C type [Cyanobacteriota bacterium]
MKKILYIDLDNVLVDFPSAFSCLPPELLREYEGRLDEIPGIFSRMKPLDGALFAFERLTRHFDVYILSTAPWGNPSAWSDKLLWVKTYLGDLAHKRLILSHHKHLNQGHFLIDDRRQNGAGQFGGELLLFGSESFPDWGAVLAYLEDRA